MHIVLEDDPFKWAVTSPPYSMIETYNTSNQIGCMPPSYLVDQYFIRTHFVVSTNLDKMNIPHIMARPVELVIKYNFDLIKKLFQGWEGYEYPYDAYVNHSHRCSVIDKGAVANEQQVKMKRWINFKPAVDRLNTVTKVPALDMFKDYLDSITCTYGDHTVKYVSSHGSAHPVRNYSWNQLLRDKKLRRLHKFSQQTLKLWRDNYYLDGDWAMHPGVIGRGARSRTPAGTELAWNIYLLLKRMRRVGFVPGPSSLGAFDPHEAQVKRLRKIFDYFEQRWGTRIISPKTEGGSVYIELQEHILDGKELRNYDVRGMELITPSIIAKSTTSRPFGVGMITFKNGTIFELISGVFPTSDVTMLAHLVLLDYIMKKVPILIVILGDDVTIVGGKLALSLLYERVIKDERIHRTLGLSIGKKIHPAGSHIMIDRADKRINIPADNKWHLVKQKLPFEERSQICDLFLGIVMGRDFAEVLNKFPSMGGFYSPKEWIIHHAINQAGDDISGQYNKQDILDAYPNKTPIKGGHSDVNRMLVDRGLDPIYEDSDELHHNTAP